MTLKMTKFEILKESKFSPFINFRAKIGPFNEIKNTIYGIYSESSRAIRICKKKSAKKPFNANYPFFRVKFSRFWQRPDVSGSIFKFQPIWTTKKHTEE